MAAQAANASSGSRTAAASRSTLLACGAAVTKRPGRAVAGSLPAAGAVRTGAGPCPYMDPTSQPGLASSRLRQQARCGAAGIPIRCGGSGTRGRAQSEAACARFASRSKPHYGSDVPAVPACCLLPWLWQ